MDQYIISVHELYERVKEMLDRGMDFVEISLMEADNSDSDHPIPACVHFDAFSKNEPEFGIDFEEIDVVQSFE